MVSVDLSSAETLNANKKHKIAENRGGGLLNSDENMILNSSLSIMDQKDISNILSIIF